MDVSISKDDLLKMLQATGKSQFTLKEFRQFVLDKWDFFINYKNLFSFKSIKYFFVFVKLK